MTGAITEGMGNCCYCNKPIKDGQPVGTPKPPIIGVAHKGCSTQAWSEEKPAVRGQVYAQDFQQPTPFMLEGETLTLHDKVAKHNAKLDAEHEPQKPPPMEEPPVVAIPAVEVAAGPRKKVTVLPTGVLEITINHGIADSPVICQLIGADGAYLNAEITDKGSGLVHIKSATPFPEGTQLVVLG